MPPIAGSGKPIGDERRRSQIGRAGLDAVEEETRNAVEPLTAEDGSISFDTNLFIYDLGQA